LRTKVVTVRQLADGTDVVITGKMRVTSRRYEQEAIARPVAQQLPQRRALGDITNTNVADDSKQNATKKAASLFHHNIQQQPAIPAPVVAPVTKMETEPEDDRVYMQRPSDDIDARDAGNPVLATTYVNEMYSYFADTEKQFLINNAYMANQPYINERMRSILVDWLVRYTSYCFNVYICTYTCT
jgi:hypothetical protein